MKENVIVNTAYSFAVKIVKFCFEIQYKRKKYVLSSQILKIGTSIGANIVESQGAISKAEFIARVQNSFNESKETKFWTRLIRDSYFLKYIGPSEFKGQSASQVLTDCDEIITNLTSILKSSKANK